jgi:hypothetical protein
MDVASKSPTTASACEIKAKRSQHERDVNLDRNRKKSADCLENEKNNIVKKNKK